MGVKRGVNRNKHSQIIAKPAFILSIINLKEKGKTVNKFTYEELDKVCQEIFSKFFVKSHQHNLTPLYYPFYNLHSQKFWHLVWRNSETTTKSLSRAWIERYTKYAYIDQEFWIQLSHPIYREKQKQHITEEKVLKIFKEDENNKGVFKTSLQLLMVIQRQENNISSILVFIKVEFLDVLQFSSLQGIKSYRLFFILIDGTKKD